MKVLKNSTITIRGKITGNASHSVLGKMGTHLGHVKRVVFRRIQAGKNSIPEIKTTVIREEGVTARQFNSLRIEVQGMIASYLENKSKHFEKVERRKKKFEEELKEETNPRRRTKIERKLAKLEKKLTQLKEERENPSICFGGKRLFFKQFFLKENGFSCHEEWKKEWVEARSSEFFLVGSKDEKFGNQSCQLLPGGLELRLTDRIAQEVGKKRVFIPVQFTYYQEKIQAAQAAGMALSYKFIKKRNSWYVHLSFSPQEEVPQISNSLYGALGIDLNPSCIACTHVDGEGNLVHSFNIPLALRGLRSEQTEGVLAQAIKQCVDYAVFHKIPIVIEKLDFAKKKEELLSRNYNRMLSNFAYSTFHTLIDGQCYRAGIQCKQVNPAFTSVIGKAKFSEGYGLNTHMAAAMAIARRGLGFGEALRAKAKRCIALPRRNRANHIWSDWRTLSSKAQRRKRTTPGRQRSGRAQSGSEDPPNSATVWS